MLNETDIKDYKTVGYPQPKPHVMRELVLDEAHNNVMGQRNQDYGSPEDNFKDIASLWNSYFTNSSKGIPNIRSHDVAVLMMLVKIARLKASPGHRDSWVDTAGYAACGAECAIKGQA